MTRNFDILPVVRVLLPSYPEIQNSDVRQISEYTTLFIEAEIRDMDIFLRLPCLAMLKVFHFLPIITYGRPYKVLTSDKQKEYVSKWEDSKFRVIRDFIKLFRYLTILSFYDHPLVQKAIGVDRGRYREDSIFRRLELIKAIG